MDHHASGASLVAERGEQQRRLRGALIVTSSFLVIEIIGGVVSGSLALLADATHMFADVGALILAYAAMTLAGRAPSTKYTFGFYRAEILAAFVNAQILLLLAVAIFYAAYLRLAEPPEVATGIMTWVALGGLVANLIAMKLLHGGRGHSLNIRAAYLEVFADMVGSVAVIVTSIVMGASGWYWLDPLVSAGIGLLILPRTLLLLKQSAHILLEGTPAEMDMGGLVGQVEEIPGVEEVHDLHVWTLTSGLHAASLHIRVDDDRRGRTALAAVQRVLRESAGVEHATIQVEWGPAGACRTGELSF